MAEPLSNYHEIPNPDNDAAGRNHHDRGNFSITKNADKWRPAGAPPTEPKVSTVSRFAGRLIDRLTGKCYTADEIEGRVKPELVDSAPENGNPATCLLNPAGSTENDILLTTDIGSVAANSLTARIIINSTDARTSLEVNQSANAITIEAGDKRRMIITGTIDEPSGPAIDLPLALEYDGEINGRPSWSDGSFTLAWSGTNWVLDYPLWAASWVGSGDTTFPDNIAIVWSGDGEGTGEPIVTASLSPASEVIDVVNTALAGTITASDGPSSDGTGTIAAVASTPFIGGTDATASNSGIQVTDTHVYFRTPSGTWKELELQNLS
jgi:hypothetical protein